MRCDEPLADESIFDEALSLPPGPARSDLIDARCGKNDALRNRVLALLAAYETSNDLETPICDAFVVASRPVTLVGERVGRFEILELLGEGGMGEVYLARDSHDPRTLVAVKVIKPGMDSRQILARFELEQKALRGLNHPNIAKWIDADVTGDSRPFLVMELVRGLSITEYCDRESLPIEERIRLMIDVCSALQDAHRNGIVHRDLKPSNILVSRHSGEPVVKVIDFGVAKALDCDRSVDTRFTSAAQWIGTPCYMSPEQARWSSDVDARTDVYSLGAILYELLTGSTPLEPTRVGQLDVDELRAVICEERPLRPSLYVSKLPSAEAKLVGQIRGLDPSRLAQKIRGGLDWVTLKSLEKERTPRYASAGELGNDLLAVLEHRRTSAGAPGIAFQVARWAKRNRRWLQAATTVSLLACLLFGLLLFQQLQTAARLREEASAASRQRAEDELTNVEFTHDIRSAAMFLESRDTASARPLLEKWRRAGSPFRDRFVLNYLHERCEGPIAELRGHRHAVLDMDVSTDGRWIASSDLGGDIVIWDAIEARETHRLHPSDAEVIRVRFSPDGQYLASTGTEQQVRIWSTNDWTLVGQFPGDDHTITGLAWSPDGKFLASGDRDGVVHIWEVASKTRQHTLDRHAEPVRSIVWSPDGTTLATADGSQGVHIWDTSTWTKKTFVSNDGKGTLAIAFSHDSRFLVFGGYSRELIFVNLSSGEIAQRTQMDGHIWSLQFGTRYELFVGRHDGSLQFLHFTTSRWQWEPVRTTQISDSGATVRAIATADPQRVYVASEEDQAIRIFPLPSLTAYQATDAPPMPVGRVESSNLVLVNGDFGEIRRADDGQTECRIPYRADRSCPATYCPVTEMVAISGRQGNQFTVYVYRRPDWQLVARFDFPGPAYGLSFSRDGRYLAASGNSIADGVEAITHVWDFETLAVRELARGRGKTWARAAFSPHSDVLILGDVGSRKLACLKVGTFEVIREVETSSPWESLIFLQTTDQLVVGQTNRLSVWTGDLSQPLGSFSGTPLNNGLNNGVFRQLALTPDDTTIAAFHGDSVVKFLDRRTQSELFSVPVPSSGNVSLGFLDPSTLHIDTDHGASILAATVPPQVAGTHPNIATGALPRGVESLDVHFNKPVHVTGNLVSWWTGDNVATDTVGGNHGSLVDGASYDAGQVGRSFRFNGLHSHVQVGDRPGLKLTGKLTLDAWVRPTGRLTRGFQTLVVREGEYLLGLDREGSIHYAIANPRPGFVSQDTEYTLHKSGPWRHVALTYDGRFARVYVDGVEVHSAAAYGRIGDDDSNTSNDFRIGGREYNNRDNFRGNIDEVGVYNRALRADEVKAIYGAGAAGKGRQVPLSIHLAGPGADRVLGTADDVPIPVSLMKNSGRTSTIAFPGLADGAYRLTVDDEITDLAGIPLDGDSDGMSGGDYVQDFVVDRAK